MAWDNGREARSVGRASDDDTFQREMRRLIPADADAVAAAAAPTMLHQAFSRARTVVYGQPLGLPR